MVDDTGTVDQSVDCSSMIFLFDRNDICFWTMIGSEAEISIGLTAANPPSFPYPQALVSSRFLAGAIAGMMEYSSNHQCVGFESWQSSVVLVVVRAN